MQANHSAQLPRAGTQPAAVKYEPAALLATPRCKSAAMTAGEVSENAINTGSASDCKGPGFDARSLMSSNLAEWTDSCSGTTNCPVIGGKLREYPRPKFLQFRIAVDVLSTTPTSIPLLRAWKLEPSLQMSCKASSSPTIDVVAAIIVREGCVLISKRGQERNNAGLWEFPGGRVESGEDHRQALRRELKECFNIDCEIGSYVTTSRHRYTQIVSLLFMLQGRPKKLPLVGSRVQSM